MLGRIPSSGNCGTKTIVFEPSGGKEDNPIRGPDVPGLTGLVPFSHWKLAEVTVRFDRSIGLQKAMFECTLAGVLMLF